MLNVIEVSCFVIFKDEFEKEYWTQISPRHRQGHG